MGFLKLNVYEHPSGVILDPDTVVQRVMEEFPETTVLPGDQLARSAEQAQAQGAAVWEEMSETTALPQLLGGSFQNLCHLRRSAAAASPPGKHEENRPSARQAAQRVIRPAACGAWRRWYGSDPGAKVTL